MTTTSTDDDVSRVIKASPRPGKDMQAHKQGLTGKGRVCESEIDILTQHMQIDLAYGVADSVVGRANINTSLVPVHFLNYIRWGHVLILACGWKKESR